MTKRSYPVSTMQRAITLHASGWSYSTIPAVLDREGLGRPSPFTVRLWVDPVRREKSAAASRRRNAARSAARSEFRFPAGRSVEWRLGRMRVLRAAGLSYTAITKVMNVDFPDAPLSVEQVEGAIRDDRMPLPLRRLAA